MNPKSFLTLRFVPSSVDGALLLLRVWIGLSMFLIHGLDKFRHFGTTVDMFHEKMGIPIFFGAAAVLAESGCSLLLVAGLFTRWAALFLGINMTVAFFLVHHATLTFGDPRSGELAFIYLCAFLVLLIAGGGRYALDSKLGGNGKAG